MSSLKLLVCLMLLMVVATGGGGRAQALAEESAMLPDFSNAAKSLALNVHDGDKMNGIKLNSRCEVVFTSNWDPQTATFNLRDLDPGKSSVDGSFLKFVCRSDAPCVRQQHRGWVVRNEKLEMRIAGKMETNQLLLTTVLSACRP